MDLSNIALLSTSDARRITWDSSGNDAKEVTASARLLQLLEDGRTVYIVSTRTRDRLSPEKYDKCLFDLIPEGRFFTPTPELLDGHCAQDEGFIEMWKRVLTHFNIEIPEDTSKWGRSWMDLRQVAADAGVIVR